MGVGAGVGVVGGDTGSAGIAGGFSGCVGSAEGVVGSAGMVGTGVVGSVEVAGSVGVVGVAVPSGASFMSPTPIASSWMMARPPSIVSMIHSAALEPGSNPVALRSGASACL